MSESKSTKYATVGAMLQSKSANLKSLTLSAPNTASGPLKSKPAKYTLGAMSKAKPASPKPLAESKPTTYTLGAMSKPKAASPKPPATGDEFPALAPSAKKLDLTPRPPMAQMPLAGYGKPDPRAQPTKCKDDTSVSNADGLPRCADPRCPIKGFHLAKAYSNGSRDLPNAVEVLISKACWASERGVNKALEQSSKRLDLFFSIHSRRNFEESRPKVRYVEEEYEEASKEVEGELLEEAFEGYS